jgi:hypothetical protein
MPPLESAWVRIASSVRDFVNVSLAKPRTLEAMRTQALSIISVRLNGKDLPEIWVSM